MRYVVSLGGNALGNNAEEQKLLVSNVAKYIVKLMKDGHEVVIVHGNGPQVGMINNAFNEAKSNLLRFARGGDFFNIKSLSN